ncbi:hypothetical protein BZM27_38830 [Paraburkholderia steynii]|uniref:Surface-adhesin protein E-like domain-containing protein n=1 Tax=Paraburkholderia steynii TaxID=1245441 RepID=A0A4R0X3N5_9BURK|nr:hypothetical protein BZM27_38830 [Paraburkholderia steynii]
MVLNFDTPQKLNNGKVYRSMGVGVELDCHAWQYAVISTTAATDIWVNGKGVALYNSPRKMEKPDQGSMEESLLKNHCITR